MGSKAKRATKPASDAAPPKRSGKGPGWKPGPGQGYKNPVGLNGSVLEDMRKAYNEPITPKTPASIKGFRELFLKDAGKFMTLYVKLLDGEKPKDDAVPVGEAEEGCRRMINELLDEIGVPREEKPDRKDANDPPGPGTRLGESGGGPQAADPKVQGQAPPAV